MEVEIIVYSELREEGTLPIAWIKGKHEIPSKDILNVALKSISLLEHDKLEANACRDPKSIVESAKYTFGILPFPDQKGVGLAYIFNYLDKRNVNIISTLTLIVNNRCKNALFVHHENIEKHMKFTVFEILKLMVANESIPSSEIEEKLSILLEKINRVEC